MADLRKYIYKTFCLEIVNDETVSGKIFSPQCYFSNSMYGTKKSTGSSSRLKKTMPNVTVVYHDIHVISPLIVHSKR